MTQAGADRCSWYLEYIGGSSDKFYRVTIVGGQLTTHWGRRGTAGQMQVKEFASYGRAYSEAQRKIAEKTGKGYDYAVDPQAPVQAAVLTPAVQTTVQTTQSSQGSRRTKAVEPTPTPAAAESKPIDQPLPNSGVILWF